MSEQIDYFYTHMSPWAYLGHQDFLRLTKQYHVKVHFRPLALGQVFEQTGGLPLGQRHPARQAYRWIELQRWKEKRQVALNFKPAFFPTNPLPSDLAAVVLQETDGPVGQFSLRVFQAIWAEDKDIGDERVVSDILLQMGLKAEEVMKKTRDPHILEAFEENKKHAISMGVVGSPAYVLKGEPFWGQDRLDLLEDALRSSRAPYSPL
ncbi:2-hydroxychromene-2-carboxylate isomerase [Pseudovibrio sp. SPO723]|uniref:2-hydroxychromene-2-carboxylate isomerase n=1 Tax=Nesiotobacter zosterae TaxID=392721 RepID=UPI0029C34992|nr:2-hydroxychromene-2-carboxylate isomerase [Pseudovibrio sp. SPO723]MDX5593195.1 2-hydroxychromene-2-carboxylate isomerase [Pseudovibrio sp. SPO723]